MQTSGDGPGDIAGAGGRGTRTTSSSLLNEPGEVRSLPLATSCKLLVGQDRPRKIFRQLSQKVLSVYTTSVDHSKVVRLGNTVKLLGDLTDCGVG